MVRRHGALAVIFTAMLAAGMQVQAQAAPQAAPASAQQVSPAQQPNAQPANTGVPLADPLSHCRAAGQDYEPMDEKRPCPGSTAQAAPPARKTYTVPTGTKILLELRSALNTKSAQPGDGVYLDSTFPVVVGNRVLIPAGVYVQGVVDRVVRAGHVKGRAQLDMHFTSIIFPNGSVVEIPGMVDNLPGSKKQSVSKNGEGTIEQDPDKGRNAGKVAEVSIPAGGSVGSIAGLGSGHPMAGGLAGLAAGAAAAGVTSLFTRGADVEIPSGTQVEMVLLRPLVLEESNLAGVGAPGTASGLVPAANQPKPLDKPHKVFCPPGSLGCL